MAVERKPDARTHPSRRERQADQTRREILHAARTLFAKNGYAGTTVKHVADQAGVSSQTVYDSVGSKRALVLQLNDMIDAEAGIADIAKRAATERDPQLVIAIPAQITCAILENSGDILRAILSGADTEPELRDIQVEGDRRHREGTARIVHGLHSHGALRDDVTEREASESLSALTDVSLGLILFDRYNWSLERIESWMNDSACRILFDPRQ
ncbi:MAG: TetR/AcrR family transcriptional regulator [Candidatus Nanopelagicales bacterium]